MLLITSGFDIQMCLWYSRGSVAHCKRSICESTVLLYRTQRMCEMGVTHPVSKT